MLSHALRLGDKGCRPGISLQLKAPTCQHVVDEAVASCGLGNSRQGRGLADDQHLRGLEVQDAQVGGHSCHALSQHRCQGWLLGWCACST